jgi:hypothetical protein
MMRGFNRMSNDDMIIGPYQRIKTKGFEFLNIFK